VRERKVEAIVRDNLSRWQNEGMVPDMAIEPGDKTDEPIRTRGWTCWHHLFNARQLLGLSALRRAISRETEFRQAALLVSFCIALDNYSKLCSWNTGHPGSGEYTAHVFYNQALNAFFSYSARSVDHICKTILAEEKRFAQSFGGTVNDPVDLGYEVVGGEERYRGCSYGCRCSGDAAGVTRRSPGHAGPHGGGNCRLFRCAGHQS